MSQRLILEQARRVLERRMQAFYGCPLQLRLNNNRRTYFSVSRPKGEAARLSLHRCFAEAPDEILEAVAAMMKARAPEAAERCRLFVAQYDQKRAGAGQAPRLAPGLRRTKGRHHDLKELAESVNQRYFQGALAIRITWGKNSDPSGADGMQSGRRKRRRSVRYGSYDHSLDLVRINRILDSSDVPRFYLDYLIYHELLHKALGFKEGARRRRVHHGEFLLREKQHEHYHDAIAWEKQFFEQLASGRRRPGRKAGVLIRTPIIPAKPSHIAAEALKSAPDSHAPANFTQLTLFDLTRDEDD
ncbi:MAG: hypothetical protein NTX50_14905 [Candidatus Sumerlaeota bacterium]|nr:hypothetical protein [Candidatus Sumerlaeota bacterium]